MALGKLAIVIGAGIVGTIYTREGRLSDITDIFTGALKIVTKRLQQDKDNTRSTSKPQNDSLLAQVNNLRQELQLITSRPVTIITRSGSGSKTYGFTAVIVVGVVGFVYIKWKGWKISDMMFATRRGLSDACNTVGKQLELISSSITAAKRHLSSRIDRVDANLDDCKEIAYETKGEVSELHGKLTSFHTDVKSVRDFVETLESKLDRIEGSQEFAIKGVYRLCQFAEGLEQSRSAEHIQELPSNSRQAIELSPAASIVTRTSSLPPLVLEAPSSMASPSTVADSPRVLLPPRAVSASPSTVPESPRVLRPSTAVSASGLKELQEISTATKPSTEKLPMQSEGISGFGNGVPWKSKPTSSGPNSSISAWKLPVLSILSRSRSSAT